MKSLEYNVREAHKSVDLLKTTTKEGVVKFLKTVKEPLEFDVRVCAYNSENRKYSPQWCFGGDFLSDPNQLDYLIDEV